MQGMAMQGENVGNLGVGNGIPKQQMQHQTAQQVQQRQISVDYSTVFRTMISAIKGNKDVVNFAYYLYKRDFAKDFTLDDEDSVTIGLRVNFCDCEKYRSKDKMMNVSRLEQMYTADIFSADDYVRFAYEKEGLPDNLVFGCSNCVCGDEAGFSVCPYNLCCIIVKLAQACNVEPEKVFSDILGADKIVFYGRNIARVDKEIPEEVLKGINAKSAHSAYLLLASRLVDIKDMQDGIIRYTHLPLCRRDKRRSVVTDMLDFWKTKSGVMDSISIYDRSTFLECKTEGCRQCVYEQCPHKLAAYFMYLGYEYGVMPVELAYKVAVENTHAGITVGQNYQFNRYLTNIENAPMRTESKEEYVKMIHYIVGRKKNRAIPFLPFNVVMISPDREKASEVISEFTNAIWYFDYYRQDSSGTSSKSLYLSAISFQSLLDEYQNASAGTTFVLYDIALLCDNNDFKAGYHRLLKIMEDRRKEVMSIVIGDSSEISRFFGMYPAFRNKIFTKTLEMFDMGNTSVVDALLDKLTENFNVSEDVSNRLEQYVRVAYPSSPLRSMEFVNDLYEKLLFAHYNHDVNASAELYAEDIPYVKPPRSEQDIFAEINRLIGLDNVKQELRDVNDLVKFNIKMGAHNKNAVNLHMMFTGNPGTGKTTVAKLTAEILHSIGFIQENKLVVCSAKDLIGEYVGQTTPKTAKMCEQAYNGVLFIDEAYQLNPYTSNNTDVYKEECIAELIQQMENNRDKLVVIFAGYTAEMEDFLNRANTGLSSRIGKVIEFPDYSAEELLEIFESIVGRAGMQLGEGAKEKAYRIFEAAKQDTKRFGNARYARNLYERSLMQHAAITANMDKDDPVLRVLSVDEITAPAV